MLKNRLFSRQFLGLVAVISMLAIAGCLTPPGPPGNANETPTPEPSPYVQSGAGITYEDVYADHYEQLNQSEGFAVTYNVTIKDPRISNQEQIYQEQYLMNIRENETRFRSNFTGINKSVYKNSVLYYERTGGQTTQAQTTVRTLDEIENDSITMEKAAGNSTLIKTGLSSSQYSLSSVQYVDGVEESTYTASQSVSNYDVSDLVPSDIDYRFGNPQITSGSEQISSEVVMTKDGMMKKYTFTYSATMFVNGTEEEYEMNITYTVAQSGPDVIVEEPPWVQNTSQSDSARAN